MRTIRLLSLGLVAILAAACSSSGSSATPAASSAAPAASSAAPSASTAAAPSPSDDTCTAAKLTLVTPGKLTIGTDNPAYPPYFLENDDKSKTKPWELGDPTNGTGFESAVGFAIAKELGFTSDQVAWAVVPFTTAIAPGVKTFDFDLNQINYRPERAQNVDLTDGYYFGNQSLVVLKTNPLAKATTIAELKGGVFGAQVGTTSLDLINTVIAPTAAAQVYDTTDLAIAAVKNKTLDGIVVDLPTADFITNVQLDGSTIVGQFEAGTPEYFSALLSKDSPLTDCIDLAIKTLTEDGTLDQLASKWLPFQDTVPVFKP